MHMVGVVLKKVGWGDLDDVEVRKEEDMLALLDDEGVAKVDESNDDVDSGEDEEKLVKKVQQKNEQSYLQWAKSSVGMK
jgi:hypothetical protein